MFIPIPPGDSPHDKPAPPPAAAAPPAHAEDYPEEEHDRRRSGSLVVHYVPENVVGVAGMSAGELARELERGGRFVIYQYCISVIFMTFLRPSAIHFIRAGESAGRYAGGFSFMSSVLGWWGIPWGPIYTLKALATNAGGGIDVTDDVLAQIAGYAPRRHAADEEPQPSSKRRGRRRRG